MDRQDDADRGPGDADAGLGHAIYRLAARIFPICRSITGDGVRQTLHCLRELVDIELHEDELQYWRRRATAPRARR